MSAPASRSRSLLSGLMGLEIIGTDSEVWVQVVCQSADATLVAQQLMAQFPEVKITWAMENLLSVWGQSEGEDEDAEAAERVVLDFGLWQELIRPLETGSRVDPLVSLIGGMAHLREGEAAVRFATETWFERPLPDGRGRKNSGRPVPKKDRLPERPGLSPRSAARTYRLTPMKWLHLLK